MLSRCLLVLLLPKCWLQSVQTTMCTCPHTSKRRCQLETPHVQSIFTLLPQALRHPARQTACRFAVYTSPTRPGPPGVMAEPQRQAGFWPQWNLLKLFTTALFSTEELPHPSMKATSRRYFFPRAEYRVSSPGKKAFLNK